MSFSKPLFFYFIFAFAVAAGMAFAAGKEQCPLKKIEKSDAEWKKELTPEQYEVMRKKSTERAFTGGHVSNHEEGIYRCAACGAVLFDSKTKFDSGTGWPSFWAAKEKVAEKEDNSHSMQRTEVLCPVCGAHLGHLFDDGPQPTGKRYCINSVSLKFDKSK